MNGHVCCILGVCCPPGSAAQRNALAAELVKDGISTEAEGHTTADWILKHFDLAPKGSLQDLKAAIGTMVKEAKERP